MQINIYIPLWLDLLLSGIPSSSSKSTKFTFHYGQIYYNSANIFITFVSVIYIPLWLDLLYLTYNLLNLNSFHLHSTMVRFIITYSKPSNHIYAIFTFHYGQIYYPFGVSGCVGVSVFTFHYGQIYYQLKNVHSIRNYRIYIPLWLDLLLCSYTNRKAIKSYLHSTMVRFIIY